MVVNGLMVDGVLEPEAVKFVGSMIPPFGIAISCLLTRNKYTKAEKEALKAAVPMGFCMITEGVIPIAARDLVRVVFSWFRSCRWFIYDVGMRLTSTSWRNAFCTVVY